jgi:hypothetical protein
MGSSSKDEPVLRVRHAVVGSSRHPALGDELFGVGVDGGVVKRLWCRASALFAIALKIARLTFQKEGMSIVPFGTV